MTDTDHLAALLHEDFMAVLPTHQRYPAPCSVCEGRAARLIAAGVTLAPTPPDAPEPDGVACDWDEHGRCRCKSPTPPDALREAARAVVEWSGAQTAVLLFCCAVVVGYVVTRLVR